MLASPAPRRAEDFNNLYLADQRATPPSLLLVGHEAPSPLIFELYEIYRALGHEDFLLIERTELYACFTLAARTVRTDR